MSYEVFLLGNNIGWALYASLSDVPPTPLIPLPFMFNSSQMYRCTLTTVQDDRFLKIFLTIYKTT